MPTSSSGSVGGASQGRGSDPSIIPGTPEAGFQGPLQLLEPHTQEHPPCQHQNRLLLLLWRLGRQQSCVAPARASLASPAGLMPASRPLAGDSISNSTRGEGTAGTSEHGKTHRQRRLKPATPPTAARAGIPGPCCPVLGTRSEKLNEIPGRHRPTRSFQTPLLTFEGPEFWGSVYRRDRVVSRK